MKLKSSSIGLTFQVAVWVRIVGNELVYNLKKKYLLLIRVRFVNMITKTILYSIGGMNNTLAYVGFAIRGCHELEIKYNPNRPSNKLIKNL